MDPSLIIVSRNIVALLTSEIRYYSFHALHLIAILLEDDEIDIQLISACRQGDVKVILTMWILIMKLARCRSAFSPFVRLSGYSARAKQIGLLGLCGVRV